MLPQVGRYRILRQLGKGAMGVVFLADDPLLSRQVAIKTIDLAIEDPTRREFLRSRLLRDARAAASLTHPNIVGIYDVVVEGDRACVVMEYIAGEDLAAYLTRNPVADPQFTVHVIRAMAAALDYTHARGIIHRDIKPANVMLDAASIPKITDFGIARITEGASTTMTGTVMGTIEYMAPEQVKGEQVDGRADQFALGVVAYRMLTGGTLYGNQSMATLAYKIVNEAPAPVRSRNSGLPAGVDPVLAKALAKAADDRYRNCAEFAEALGGAMAGVDRQGPTVAMTAPPPTPPPPRSSGIRTAVVAVALAGAAGAIAAMIVWKPWLQPAQPATSALAVSKPAAEPAPPTNLTKGPLLQPGASLEKAAAAKGPVAKSPVKKAPADPPHQAAEAKAGPVEHADDVAPDAATPPADTPRPAVDAINRGRELMKQEQFAEAVQAFTKAADIRPNWAPGYVNRGGAYQHLEQYDAAIRDFSRAIRLNPKLFSAYLGRAQCYVHQKQDDLAFDDFNQSLALKPDAHLALAGRAAIYLRRKAYHKALADYNDAIRLSPDLASAYRGRANARRALGDERGAQADEEKYKEIFARKGDKGG
ncbi:MAG: protein kinase [Bryobacteraceae bacterium]|jgi:tetratricopeptide (TPR) repeat protein